MNQHSAALDEFQRQDRAWKEKMSEDIETIKSALMHFQHPGDESESGAAMDVQQLESSASEVSGVGFDVKKVVSILQVFFKYSYCLLKVSFFSFQAPLAHQPRDHVRLFIQV